jgi:hypothetical protein
MGGPFPKLHFAQEKLNQAQRWHRRLMKGIHRVVLHPICAASITWLIIIAGGLFGLFAEDIKNAWPFHWVNLRWHISQPVLWSWLVAVVTAILFFFRQQADDEKREQAQQDLVDQAKELERLVRIMPPIKFLDSFATLYQNLDESAEGSLGSPQPPFEIDVVEKGVRVALSAIATLARIFDGDRPLERYAGNVMLFKESKTMSDAEATEITKYLKFCEHGVSIRNLSGVLILEPALSTTTTVDAFSPDATLAKFALPVPVKSKAGDRYIVLPGAPLAFIENRPDVHEDFSRLRQWCEQNGDFTQSVKDELSDYLASQVGHMQSFISIPLSLPTKSPFAILNVHSRRTGLLRDHPDAVQQFVVIIKPLQAILIKLLLARSECHNGCGVQVANKEETKLH